MGRARPPASPIRHLRASDFSDSQAVETPTLMTPDPAPDGPAPPAAPHPRPRRSRLPAPGPTGNRCRFTRRPSNPHAGHPGHPSNPPVLHSSNHAPIANHGDAEPTEHARPDGTADARGWAQTVLHLPGTRNPPRSAPTPNTDRPTPLLRPRINANRRESRPQ